MDFELLKVTLRQDWPVLLPIFICSIATVAVAIERLYYYQRNKRNVPEFIKRLQKELVRENTDNARMLCTQLGGIIGEVSEEGLRQLGEDKENFSRSFDITISLATRNLERGLSVLGTVGGVAPFLGLFGTVVRILFTFGDLASKGGQSSQVAYGIGSALIATAFGLLVAIVAVVFYNYFNSKVNRYMDDFLLVKLLLISFAIHKSKAHAQPQFAVPQAGV